MSESRLLRLSVAALAAASLVIGAMSPVQAEKTVRLKLHGFVPSTLPILGIGGKRFSETATRISNETLRFKFFEPGTLVPAFNYGDALIEGSLKVAYGSPGLHNGKVPALTVFVAVPFGPRAGEFYAWIEHGGGRAMIEELYDGLGMRLAYPCTTVAPETAGWFKEKLDSIEDLNGKKMRIFGYGAKVLAKFGVSTQMLAATDIYPALERGVIDGSEFSMPAIDEGLGFAEIAKFNYFPGWHQQVSLQSVDFHAETYDALSDYHKYVVEVACGYVNQRSLADSEGLQIASLKRMKEEQGVTTLRWPDEDLAKFRAAWDEVAAEESANDPVFKRVYDSYLAFRAAYSTWGNLAYVD